MPIVVDASIAASWVMPDEIPIENILLRLEVENIVVPQLWWYEIWNILAMGERRKRIDADRVSGALAFYSKLSIEMDVESLGSDILYLARKHTLTGYDAAYLELARRKKLPLATADGALLKAAAKENVMLIPIA